MRKRSVLKCGGKYSHPGGRTRCFAYGKQCFNCGKIVHFKSQCRHQKNNVHTVFNNEDCDSAPTISSIEQKNCQKTTPKPEATVRIGKIKVNFILDTGSSVNTMTEIIYKYLKKNFKLNKSELKAHGYASNKPF